MYDVPPLAPLAPLGELVPCLLPAGLELALERVVLEPDGLTLALVSTQAHPCCPLCQTAATRVQSRYTRTLLDLPWAAVRVRLALTVRRFICPTDSCVRKIFTERLPQLVAPYARRTSRLQELLLTTGFALGGEAGARQCAIWHVAVSGATLLQLLRQHPPAPGPTPRVLGVDEFARRKGRTYSTILVDLERHAVVDLLPESNNAVFATWLRAHPGIEVISRDRGEAYGTGATAGAPDAVQVADRWHILKNLGDALQKVLGRHVADLRQAAQESGCVAAAPPPLPAVPAVLPPRCRPRTPKPITRSAQRVRQLALYQRVHDLVAQGWSVAAIARELTIQKATVRKYRDMAQFRDQRTTARPSVVEPYRGYVEQRWAEGCTEVKQLWEELQSCGFRGCYKSVWQFTRGWQPPELPQAVTPPCVHPTPVIRTPRQATWLLMRPPAALEPNEIAYREVVCRRCPEVATVYPLAQAFTELLRIRAVDALDPWLVQAQQCGVREVARFALGLRQDYAAVRAALEHPWSNGQTEAQVNRVKHVKGQMYGRAKFDLLRARVLYRP